MENTKVDGYITEKLMLAFLGGCLPIYWGTEEVFDIFNKRAFLYYEPGVTVNDIVYLESNHSAYKERMSVPILAHGNDTVQKYFFSARRGGRRCSEKKNKSYDRSELSMDDTTTLSFILIKGLQPYTSSNITVCQNGS